VGIAIGHTLQLIEEGSATKFDPVTKQFTKARAAKKLPLYGIPGLLRLIPEKGNDIPFLKIKDLLLMIHQVIGLEWITFDQFQSYALIQYFRESGISSKTVSTLSTPAPFIELKTAYASDRIFIPPHKPYEQELAGLIQDQKTGRVDRHENSTKDIADAVASVVFMLSQRRSSYQETRGLLNPDDPLPDSDFDSRPSSGRELLY
jgi:hypothetical protein